MATLLKLKQGDSGTELNLNSSSSTGFRLDENGWNPAVATPVHMGDPPPVLERLDLLLSNTSYNNLASNMQSLHEMQVIANRYINDSTQENPVWLHAKMDGETGERRALVRRITVQYKAPWFGAGKSTTNIPLVITVVRGPYWENPTAMPLPDVAPSAAACVVYDYTSGAGEDIVGDAGARIRFFELKNASQDLYKFWMGIRSANKHGATGISNFVDTWECEDGTNGTDVADAVDGTASGGDRITVIENAVDWDDGDFHFVNGMSLSVPAPGNEADQMGKFLWLLRAGATSSDVWEVRLQFYLGRADNILTKDIVEISSYSGWRYYKMGIVPISLYDFRTIIDADYDTDNIGDFTVKIQARRTTDSSGTLNLDCLCLIPVDEGFCEITTPGYSLTVSDMFGQSPAGLTQVIRRDYTDNDVLGWGVFDSIENFVLPPGDGRIYCVYSGNPSVITKVITFNDGNIGRYYERWLSLRGSE